jgi:serine/threonine-protein kinase HipA
MRRTIDVFLGEAALQVGALRFETQSARQSAAFEYHPVWLAAPDRFALEPGLPLVAGMQFHPQTPEGSAFHSAVADIPSPTVGDASTISPRRMRQFQ